MSWSQGNLMWQFPFKSLNGTSCNINVYKKGYTGEFVFNNLKAAADPFFFEEDDSEDLLNDVLRYRTGYIRVIEEYAHGWLSDIYPTEAFDRYVEVLYGSELVFNGYIQVQDFCDELVPVPRVIELPIISPLGLLEQKIFTGIIPPTSKTLGELLDTALAGSYDYMYMPKKFGYPNQVSMGWKILSTVVTPWNDDFHYSMNVDTQNKVMKGESYAFLIEAICKAFGWIAHDTPGALIFTAFDYEDDYCYFPVGHIGQSGYQQDANISATAISLEDYFTLADDQANVTTLQPETGIEIDYEGDSGTIDFDFKHTYIPAQDAIITMPSEASDPDEVNSLCNLLPIPLLGEISGVGSLSFENNDCLAPGNGCCAWNGKRGVMISLASYNSGHELFTVKFYFKKRSSQSFKLSYDMTGRQNGYLRQLAFSGGDIDSYYIYTYVDATNADYVMARFSYRWGGNYPQLPRQATIFISNIKLDVFEDGEPYAEYRYLPASDSDIIPEVYNPQPAVSMSVDMPISLYRNNDHLIGASVRQTKLTTYPYMFTPRHHLVSKFKYAAALTFPHIKLFNYMNKKWRIIAQRFDPWNDEYQLTMQNSSVL